jgi:hypothetical protein
MKVMFTGSVHTINTSVETYLTKGKWYDDVTIDGDPNGKYYVIKNDNDQQRRYKAEYFVTLQQLRDKKLKDLGI